MDGTVVHNAGKSVTAALAFALLIENAPKEDNLFLALGYTQSSATNNIFECGGFGLIHYFGPKCRMCKYKGPSGKLKTAIDALEISTKTGKKIVVPFGTNTKTANNAWHGWRVAGFLFDEIDRACEESITEMQQRITAVENPHIIVTQNPNFPQHQIYKLLDHLESKGLVNYSHWILDDNIGMSKEKIQEVKDRYDPSSIFYRRYVLGERVDAEGQIFRIYDYTVINEFDVNDYNMFITIADPGQTISATTFILAAYNYKTRSMDILREFGWKNKIRGNVVEKHANQLAKDFIQFNQECIDLMKGYPSVVIIDGYYGHDFFDNAIIESRNAGLNLNIKTPVNSEGKSGKDPDDIRITKTSSLLYQGKLRFLNTCRGCINDISTLQYDMKELEKGKIKILEMFTEDGHADYADCVFYAQSYFRNFLL